MTLTLIQSGAMIEGSYRYLLWRIWNPDGPRVTFIMLNPSTGDETTDDPTIRRCVGFGQIWGYGSVWITNLFAFRSPSPHDLMRVADPVGSECNAFLLQAATQSDCLVAAWGCYGRLRERDRQVLDLLIAHQDHLFCLGKNADGTPKHPLYLRKGTERLRFP